MEKNTRTESEKHVKPGCRPAFFILLLSLASLFPAPLSASPQPAGETTELLLFYTGNVLGELEACG